MPRHDAITTRYFSLSIRTPVKLKKNSNKGVKNTPQVFNIYTQTPIKPIRKQLIFSQLKIKMLKIRTILGIFLNTTQFFYWISAS